MKWRPFYVFPRELWKVKRGEILLVKSTYKRGAYNSYNKNRRKAIFSWAAKGLFFLRGGSGYTHSGYHKTLSPTIA